MDVEKFCKDVIPFVNKEGVRLIKEALDQRMERLGMKKATPFSIGRRWRTKANDKVFDFVIIGSGDVSGAKMCRVEIVDHGSEHTGFGNCVGSKWCKHGMVAQYSHKHLKKHAELITP